MQCNDFIANSFRVESDQNLYCIFVGQPYSLGHEKNLFIFNYWPDDVGTICF